MRRAMVIGSVLEADAGRALAALRGAPAGCEWVELRADRLSADDVDRVVREVGRRVVVAVRRRVDGGTFAGTEDERRGVLERALAAGCAAIDVEWDAPFAGIAAQPGIAERVVLSHHGGPCRIDALRALLDRLAARPLGPAKLVPHASRIDDVLAVRAILDEARRRGVRLAAFASGPAGVPSRILAPAWGSFATYGSIAPGRSTAPGQLPVDDLFEIHRVLDLGPATRLHALVGAAVSESPSPAMHAAGYREARLDACYLPFETDDLEAALALASALRLDSLGVTRPFKEQMAARSSAGDEVARRSAAVNTVRLSARPVGFNTDGPAAVARVGRHLDAAGARVAILGSGGTARGFAAAFVAARAEVTLYGRSIVRTERAARATGARALPLERFGSRPWDALVHATPLGRDGARFLDPARLDGRVVLDAVYAPRTTALVEDARARGLAVVDGLELLAAQAALQFERMTGKSVRYETLHGAATGWLGRRAP